MTVQVKVPALDDSITEVSVAQWFKKVGDEVELDDTLVSVETDKVSVDLPAPQSGVLTEIRVQVDQVAKVGQVLGLIEPSASASPHSEAQWAWTKRTTLMAPHDLDPRTPTRVLTLHKMEGQYIRAAERLVTLECAERHIHLTSPGDGVLIELEASCSQVVTPGQALAVLGIL